MKKYQLYLSVIAASMLASCNHEDVKPGVNTKNISIGSVSTSSSATSRADDVIVRELPPVEIDGNILTITETIRPIERAISRAEDPDAMARLKNDGFKLSGWAEFAQGTQIVPLFNGADVKYANDAWSLTGQYTWRENSTHHFWANHGTITNAGLYEDKNNSNKLIPNSFTFEFTDSIVIPATKDETGKILTPEMIKYGTKDLMLAYQSQFFKTEDDKVDNPTYITNLNFTHALAHIVINNQVKILEQESEGSTTYIDNPLRGSILSYGINGSLSGSCVAEYSTTDNRLSYNWTQNTPPSQEPDLLLYDIRLLKEVGFVIPQTKGTNTGGESAPKYVRALTLKILDNKRIDYDKQGGETKTEEEAIADATTSGTATVVIGEGNWESGYEYTYTITGNIKLPYISYNIDTGDALSGKGFHAINIGTFDNIDKIKSFTIEWTGAPTTNGNDTYGGMSIEPITSFKEVNPKTIESTYVVNKQLNPNYINIAWNYNAHNKEMVKDSEGKTIGTLTKNGKKEIDWKCSATFDLEKIGITGPFRLWIVFNGGSNSDKTTWDLSEVKVTNIVYYSSSN